MDLLTLPQPPIIDCFLFKSSGLQASGVGHLTAFQNSSVIPQVWKQFPIPEWLDRSWGL